MPQPLSYWNSMANRAESTYAPYVKHTFVVLKVWNSYRAELGHKSLGVTKTKTVLVFWDYENSKIEFVEVWSQVITEVGLICQIIFWPILSTEI